MTSEGGIDHPVCVMKKRMTSECVINKSLYRAAVCLFWLNQQLTNHTVCHGTDLCLLTKNRIITVSVHHPSPLCHFRYSLCLSRRNNALTTLSLYHPNRLRHFRYSLCLSRRNNTFTTVSLYQPNLRHFGTAFVLQEEIIHSQQY